MSPPFSGPKNKPDKKPACHMFSRWFLARHILLHWTWRRHVSPKCRLIFNGLHGVMQKVELFISTAVGTYSLDCYVVIVLYYNIALLVLTVSQSVQCSAVQCSVYISFGSTCLKLLRHTLSRQPYGRSWGSNLRHCMVVTQPRSSLRHCVPDVTEDWVACFLT
jgi:hypothetical protein